MAEGFSAAERGPAPAAPDVPGALSGAAGRTAPHLGLYAVEVPPAGRRQIYPIYPQLFIRLNFDLALPAAGRRGDDMVLCFDNGGEAVFQGFVGIAEIHPTLHLLPPDGSLLPGDTLAAALVELGEAPALPSDDGLAALAAHTVTQPEAAATPPAEPQPALPEPDFPVPDFPVPDFPVPDFPVQEILQDLEAQGVVPAAAPPPVEAAGSAADLVHQVASALPDFAAGAEGETGAPSAPAVAEDDGLADPALRAAAQAAPEPRPQPRPLEAQAPELEQEFGQDRVGVVAPEMIGAGVEAPWTGGETFAGTEAAPPSAPVPETAPPAEATAWPEAAVPDLPPVEAPAAVQPEPPAGPPMETDAEAGDRTWVETWAGIAATPEPEVATPADPLLPAAPSAESVAATPEPPPWPALWPEPASMAASEVAELDRALPEAPPPEAPPRETEVPEVALWQPEADRPAAAAEVVVSEASAALPAQPQASEPPVAPAIEAEGMAPAAPAEPFDVGAEPPENTPDAVLSGIAMPDFAALAVQAGLDLPPGPEPESGSDPVADPGAAAGTAPGAGPEAEPVPPPMELFESPADPLPPSILETGATAGAAEAPEAGRGAGILRSAMASMLRAGNRILPPRGFEAEDAVAEAPEAMAEVVAEAVAAPRSVLDEEEVLELTEPAETPLPVPPVILPESAGAPPPPLEEGKGPVQDLDAIELFSDPLSYGAGVMEGPAAAPMVPQTMAREPGAGRRLGRQEPTPAAVRDAVRLALHQMDEGDLFDFGADEGDAPAAPSGPGGGPRALPPAAERSERSET